MMNKVLKAHLALLTVNILYGANYAIAKEVMPEYIKPFGFVVLRVLGALPLFWIAGMFVKKKIQQKDFPKLLLLAVFGIVLNQLTFLKGLSMTSSINASILMITTPILVVVIAAVIIKEMISVIKLIGIVLGFAGACVLLIGKGNVSFSSDTFTGDLLIFINAISWGFYLVLARPLMKKYNTVTIVKWVFLFGLVMVLPFGYREVMEIKWSAIPMNVWLCIFYVVILTTFVAYILNTYALNALSPSVVSAYIYLQPFLAALISVWMGQDEIDATKIFSAVLIFTGVYLASRGKT